MLSDFFKNKQNKNYDNVNIEHYEIDFSFEDPEEVINEYFDLICNVKTETQLYNFLVELFGIAYELGQKELLYNDIVLKLEQINCLNEGE